MNGNRFGGNGGNLNGLRNNVLTSSAYQRFDESNKLGVLSGNFGTENVFSNNQEESRNRWFREDNKRRKYHVKNNEDFKRDEGQSGNYRSGSYLVRGHIKNRQDDAAKEWLSRKGQHPVESFQQGKNNDKLLKKMGMNVESISSPENGNCGINGNESQEKDEWVKELQLWKDQIDEVTDFLKS